MLISVNFPALLATVSLPTSSYFFAVGSKAKRQQFSTLQLDRADVFAHGAIRLLDGTRLRDVVIKPTHMPYEPSELDCRILRHVIAMTNSTGQCLRSSRQGVYPRRFRRELPSVGGLDYNALKSIKRPPIKEIARYLRQNDPTLKNVSHQKIVDGLAIFGVR